MRRKECEGVGYFATDEQWQTTICPVYHGIASVEDGRVDWHTVRVIDFDAPVTSTGEPCDWETA